MNDIIFLTTLANVQEKEFVNNIQKLFYGFKDISKKL
jgi:hypothetical protein